METPSYAENKAAQENASARARNGSSFLTVKRCANVSQASIALEPKVLKRAMKEVAHMDLDQRIFAAENRDSSAAILTVLAEDKNREVRKKVAYHKNTPAKILEFLSKDNCHGVRLGVATNRSTSSEGLSFLAKDKSHMVRYSVARNRNTPANALNIFITR